MLTVCLLARPALCYEMDKIKENRVPLNSLAARGLVSLSVLPAVCGWHVCSLTVIGILFFLDKTPPRHMNLLHLGGLISLSHWNRRGRFRAFVLGWRLLQNSSFSIWYEIKSASWPLSTSSVHLTDSQERSLMSWGWELGAEWPILRAVWASAENGNWQPYQWAGS